jgi:hypothetical protein
MSRFSAYLKRLEQRLNLHKEVRSSILIEIAADMEEMYNVYIEKEIHPDEAEQKVIKSFDLTDEALGQLAKIHNTPARRFANKMPGKLSGIIGNTGSVLLGLTGVFLITNVVKMALNFDYSLAFSWIYMILCLLVFGLISSKSIDMIKMKSLSSEKLSRGLSLILFCGVQAILISFLGVIDSFGNEIEMFAFQYAVEPAKAIENINPLLKFIDSLEIQSSFGINLAFVSWIFWLVFSIRSARFENLKANNLLQ